MPRQRAKQPDALRYAKTNIPRDGQKPHATAVWNEAAADRVVKFIEEYCRHSRGDEANQCFTLKPWQRALVRAAFGWMRPDGTRWYRRLDLWLPRKNGKSTFAAAIALYLLYADNEIGAEVYLVANDKIQAGVVFKEAMHSAETDPTLSEISQCYDSDRTKAIFVPETMSSLQAISSEPKNKDGLNISGCVFDEIHELKDRNLWAKMRTGSGARKQPMMIVISTAGYDRNTVGWDEYQTDKRILAGKSKVTDRLVIIFEADPSDDWRRESTWRKANPMYDEMASCRAQIASLYAEALERASDEAAFKRYHLNLWTGSKAGAFNMERWDACGKPFALNELAGCPCWVGLDLSKRSDITAAVMVFQRMHDTVKHYYIVPQFFVPEEEIDLKESRDGVPFKEWAAAGHVTLTPGNVVDYDFVFAFLLRWARDHNPREYAYDPYNATQLANQLTAAGLQAVEFIQSIKNVAAPTKELMDLVLAGRIHHGDNPVLRWMADNAATVRDINDNEKLTKKGSTARIDGLSAIVNALGRASLADSAPSAYEHRGVRAL